MKTKNNYEPKQKEQRHCLVITHFQFFVHIRSHKHFFQISERDKNKIDKRCISWLTVRRMQVTIDQFCRQNTKQPSLSYQRINNECLDKINFDHFKALNLSSVFRSAQFQSYVPSLVIQIQGYAVTCNPIARSSFV